MNHLAHLVLSPPDPCWRIGALLGDFVRGADLATCEERVRLGIWLHRAVDAFTDQHEAFRRSKSRIEGPARRFASVLVDVFYDHFLAQRFAELAQGEDLTTFASASYAMLQERRESLRGALAVHLDRMIQNRWLEQAQSIDGVGVVLRRIALRSRRATHLERGVEELMRNYDGLRMDFAEFWPEVSRFADEHAATCAARL